MAESTVATFEIMQEPDFASSIGADNDVIDELGAIFTRLEIPLGLMNKIVQLSEMDAIHFLIDDSGSMSSIADMLGRDGRPLTRWQEVHERLIDMLELLVFVRLPDGILLDFMNGNFMNGRADITLRRAKGQSLSSFFNGGTPAFKLIDESLRACPGQSVARYFFGDGEPSGGQAEIERICKLVVGRPEPQRNPLTFLSCTNEDAIEEIAPHCSEIDDYEDEYREIILDQGIGLPFPKEFHLICALCAANSPYDLDAMHESIPFTCETLSNLLGYRLSDADFRYYFDGFLAAQKARRRASSKLDEIKRASDWAPHYAAFLTCVGADEIEAAQQLKLEELLREAPLRECTRAGSPGQWPGRAAV
ncbi:hypothetical protein T492DRAFT_832610 [Pavlovales sp. CCMP2436]|nr:hypothetical protein T492DRAFT_832610 [Pavlovales sp. CCMP2436]